MVKTMADRDKLIELLEIMPDGFHSFEDMADYLLDNGVTFKRPKVQVTRLKKGMSDETNQNCDAPNQCGC